MKKEAEKLAQDAAKQALEKLKKGESVASVEWSKEAQAIPPQAMANFQPEAGKAILTANGSEDKPVYVMSAVPGGAVLVKIVGEKQPDEKEIEAMIPQAREMLNRMNAENNLTVYLKYLTTVLKEIPGTQPSPLKSYVNNAKESSQPQQTSQ